jgi:tetratricopeptide (TPR) repeat protein
VGLIAWPSGGCIDYGFNQVPLARDPFHIDVALVLICVAGVAWWLARAARSGGGGPGERTLVLAAAIFAFSWAPVSSLLLPSVSILAERNLYLPSFGCVLAVAVLYTAIAERTRRAGAWVLGAGVLALASLGAATLARNAHFLDPVDLFGWSAANCPESARGHFLHGAVLMDRGLAGRAAEAYRRALAISPDYTDARADLAQALSRLGRRGEASEVARAAAATSPRSIETRIAVASALAAAGLQEEGGRMLDELRRESPGDERVQFMEAQIERSAGRPDAALALFERIRDSFPESPAGFDGAGAVLMSRDDAGAARREFGKALAIDPYDASALYNLGLLALRAGQGEEGSFRTATDLFRRYLRIAPGDALGWMRLSEAREGAGDLPEAEESLRRAVASAPSHPAPASALDAFRKRHAGAQ